ncbi:hypothetical protein RUM43_004116 [Polyplax serrata]|uniref:Resistance to inhibitors of cholinesterase protein 3 N-terminal domain-containing protein n=1 Tax=Polyplax serrata TaxID=468196 RepID=A0AAN8SB86_POLSC
MANIEFGTGKTVVILSIVAACFAVLWPKIFYPMLTSNKKSDPDNLNGCCDVLFETDINAFKIMTEMCGTILDRPEYFNPRLSHDFQEGKLNKEIISTCRKEVMNMCGIDIAEFLNKKEKLGQSYRQMLDEIRSFNISICLRENFGIKPGLIGAPRRMRIWGPTVTQRHLRQERPLHLHPEMLHPALREKGRAIPQSHATPKLAVEKDKSGRPLPVPGTRPPMGGPGHVVPPPKVGGTISVVMPLYTIGIVIFFMYTVMKVFMKKTNGNDEFKDFHSDPEFRRVVFSEHYQNGSTASAEKNGTASKEKQIPAPEIWKSPTDGSTRLGDDEIDHLRKRLEETEKAMERIVAQMDTVPPELLTKTSKLGIKFRNRPSEAKNDLEEVCNKDVSQGYEKEPSQTEQVDTFNSNRNNTAGPRRDFDSDEMKPKVKVMGLEMMAECEGGQKWNRPVTPNLGVGGHGRTTPPIPPPDSPEPQNIFLEGALPQQSQLLVSDSKTQAFTLPEDGEPEPPVILSSKMTLSLINVDPSLEDEREDQVRQVPLTRRADGNRDEDQLGTADSTLLDIDSELLNDSGQIECDEEVEKKEDVDTVNNYKKMDDEDEEDASSNFTTATGRIESGSGLDLEDTTADLSTLEVLDSTENLEDLQNHDSLMRNENFEELETLDDDRHQRHDQTEEEEDDDEEEK